MSNNILSFLPKISKLETIEYLQRRITYFENLANGSSPHWALFWQSQISLWQIELNRVKSELNEVTK